MPQSKDAVDPAPRRYTPPNQRPRYPDWYRPRGYAHFDVRPHPEFAITYASSALSVERHPFWPFLQFERVSPKYARDPITGKRRKIESKRRPICYAAHLDGCIYSRYAWILNGLLEAAYQEEFGNCVLAYRRLFPPQNNITCAMRAFDEIKRLGECDAIALDVEDFFGSLDHELLRAEWAKLANFGDRLPPDHFAVFRAITSYTWVERSALAQALGRHISRRRSHRNDRVCSPSEFRSRVRQLIRRPPMSRGIPQGSPISAVLANLYMLPFDSRVFHLLRAIGASYRRYSDDILVIAPPGRAVDAERVVVAALADVKLSVKASKTVRVGFRPHGDRTTAALLDDSGKEIRAPYELQYLGLVWDGESARLRSVSLARFLKRMVRAVRSAKANAFRNGETRIRRRKLYRQFSHLGRSARVFGPQPLRARNRNFIHYGQFAARLGDFRAIRRQIGRQWSRLHTEIQRAERNLVERFSASHAEHQGERANE